MTITAERYQQMKTEIVARLDERMEKAIFGLLEKGFAHIGALPWRQQLAGFRSVTTPADQFMFTNPDYLKLLRAGLLPIPESEFWLFWLMQRKGVFEFMFRKYQRLLRQEQADLEKKPSPAMSSAAPFGGY